MRSRFLRPNSVTGAVWGREKHMDRPRSLWVVTSLLVLGTLMVLTDVDVVILFLVLLLAAPLVAVTVAYTGYRGQAATRFLRHTGRSVALIWGVFWFAFQFGAGEGGQVLSDGFALLPWLFLLSALVPWVREDWGGLWLLVAGLGLQVLVLLRWPAFLRSGTGSATEVVLWSLLLAAPAELAGLLLISAWRRER
jgi:hypothetical protein